MTAQQIVATIATELFLNTRGTIEESVETAIQLWNETASQLDAVPKRKARGREVL